MALAEYDADQFRALPFNRQIPDNTPVTGAHLQSLRMQRGWSIQEAAFHFGTAIPAWCTMVNRENENRPVPDPALSTEERSEGKEADSTCRSRWAPYNKKKKKKKK